MAWIDPGTMLIEIFRFLFQAYWAENTDPSI